jgi:hypothetical protein
MGFASSKNLPLLEQQNVKLFKVINEYKKQMKIFSGDKKGKYKFFRQNRKQEDLDFFAEYLKNLIQKNNTENIEECSEQIASRCNTKAGELQEQQVKLPKFIVENKVREMLIYHEMGTGKTCTALRILTEFLKKSFF